MSSSANNREELENELEALHARVAELERSDAERQQTLEALRASEERFRTLIEQGGDAVFVADMEGRILDVNRTACDGLGYTREELLEMNIAEVDTEVISHEHRRQFWDTVTADQPITFEGTQKRKDGSTFPVEIRTTLLSQSPVRTLLGFVRDVTERKQTERALRESEERLELAVLGTSDGLWVWEVATGNVWWSQRYRELIGYSDDELPAAYESWESLLHADDREYTLEAVRRHFEDGQAYDIEYRLRTKSGPYRWFLARGVAERGKDGKPIRMAGSIQDITERKQTAEALRQSEERFHTALKDTNITVFHQDRNLRYTWVHNPHPALSVETVLGKTDAELVPPEDAACITKLKSRVLQSGVGERAEVRFTVNAHPHYCDLSIDPVHDSSGDVIGITGTLMDITERKLAQEQVRESEERYRAIVEDTPVLICRFLPDGEIVFVNDSYCAYFGKTRENLVGTEFLSLIPEEDRQTVAANVFAATVDSPILVHEHKVITSDGGVRWQQWTNRGLFDEQGKVVAYQSIGQDITDARRAVEALQESEEKYRQLFSTESDAIIVVDLNTRRILDANPAAQELYGYSEKEFLGLQVEKVSAEPEKTAAANDAQARGDLSRVPLRYHRKRDGTVFPVEISPAAFKLKGRDVVCGMIRDITERKRAEERLRFLSLITEQVSDSVIATNLNYEITYVNQSFQEIYGYSSGEILGKSPGILNVETTADEIQSDIYRTVASGATWRGEVLNSRKDGSVLPCDLTVFPLIDEHGDTFAYAGIQRDMTERKREQQEKQELETQLRHVQKMEAVGQLAGGVAHDFNNLLTVVLGNVELLLPMMRRGLDEKSAEAAKCGLEDIKFAGQRAAALTRQLLAFGRKGMVRVEVLDLDRVIRDAEKLLRRLLPEDLVFDANVAPGVSHIRADAGQIEQVIMNLVLNARDAMPEGGTLTVACDNINVDETHAAAQVGASPGRYVMLAVSDTGIGMSQEVMEHMFEPFFTTKPAGEGAGLGLATVYGIVRRSGAQIVVQSEPGEGSTFTVYFPAVEEETVTPKVATEVQGLRGDELVLVCEDEEHVRDIACRVLRGAGYEVLQAENGREALIVAAAHDGDIDLLLSDVVMPGMNGKELAEAMTRRHPEMRVMLVSGYTDDVFDGRISRSDGKDFLHKPFSPTTLLRRVRRLLDQI